MQWKTFPPPHFRPRSSGDLLIANPATPASGGKRLVSPRKDSRRGATDGTMRKNLATKADVTKDLEEGGDDEEEKHKNVPLPHWLVPIRTQIQKR